MQAVVAGCNAASIGSARASVGRTRCGGAGARPAVAAHFCGPFEKPTNARVHAAAGRHRPQSPPGDAAKVTRAQGLTRVRGDSVAAPRALEPALHLGPAGEGGQHDKGARGLDRSVLPCRLGCAAVHDGQHGAGRCATVTAPAAASPTPPPVATAALPVASHDTIQVPSKAFLTTYCITCHNQRLKTGGLALDALDVADVGKDAEVWEKAVVKLKAGLMPPAGLPRPQQTVIDGFTASLETALDRAAAANPDPGRTEPFHRLNRAEYQNAIRDLLGIEVDASQWLPTDEISYGFDNIAGVLKLSPLLTERYLNAAQKISRLALGTPAPPNGDLYRVPDQLDQDVRLEGHAGRARAAASW